MHELLQIRDWAIDGAFFERVRPLAISMLQNGRDLSGLVKKYELKDLVGTRYDAKVSYDGELNMLTTDAGDGGRVAIIPVIGGMTRRGDMCSYGMLDYIKMIGRANASDQITGIVLDIDSPGGSVNGTYELGKAISESKKPVVAFGDNLVASAAYWIASQAGAIVGNEAGRAEFGSIGVLYIHTDAQKLIKKKIGDVEIMRAPQSTDKMRVNAVEPLKGPQRKEILERLSQTAEDFKSVVTAGRGSRLKTGDENIFTGKVYSLARALELGMIDKVGTLMDAVEMAAGGETRKSNFNSNSNSNTNQMNVLKKWFAGDAGTDNGEDKVTVSTAELAELKADMQAAQSELETVKGEKDNLTAQLSDLQAEKVQLEEKVKVLEAENTTLAEKIDETPAGVATTVVKDDEEKDKVKLSYRTSVDDELIEMKAKLRLN